MSSTVSSTCHSSTSTSRPPRFSDPPLPEMTEATASLLAHELDRGEAVIVVLAELRPVVGRRRDVPGVPDRRGAGQQRRVEGRAYRLPYAVEHVEVLHAVLVALEDEHEIDEVVHAEGHETDGEVLLAALAVAHEQRRQDVQRLVDGRQFPHLDRRGQHRRQVQRRQHGGGRLLDVVAVLAGHHWTLVVEQRKRSPRLPTSTRSIV